VEAAAEASVEPVEVLVEPVEAVTEVVVTERPQQALPIPAAVEVATEHYPVDRAWL
jgi:hypothetical protein